MCLLFVKITLYFALLMLSPQESVELVPDKMNLLTDTELTQYFIQTWSLAYNNPGAAFQLMLILQILLQLPHRMV